MKEKENNKKMNSNSQNKVEKLQSMMENQAYNPFGRFFLFLNFFLSQQ